MFGLSGEHILILAGILLVFGPRKLPELGSSVGKALKNFKEGLNGPASSGKLEARTVEARNSEASATVDPVATAQKATATAATDRPNA
ncbi:MAG TPA: twin-arginine translocase TatA/TatE family subunit [Oligoflexia bacterium]|nr:twin-arginine translocase TatA/TatE family subunit [Oligoflexia bacterium]